MNGGRIFILARRPTGAHRPDGLMPFNRPLIELLVLDAREIAAARLGDKRKWRDFCKELSLFAELVDAGMLTADSCTHSTPKSEGYEALASIAKNMQLLDASGEDDIKAGLLMAALSSFSEDVSLCELSIPDICKAVVETRAFLDQNVFKMDQIVRASSKNVPKVYQWIQSVMKGGHPKYKLDGRKVVKVEKPGKKGEKK